jgi:hypothetical protein
MDKTDKMDIEKSYAKLATKHKLPKFDAIDKIFEIGSIDKEDYLLKEIRRRMADKIDHYIEMLEGVINPETTLSGLHECKFFNDDEKTELFELYRKLMAHIRQCDILNLDSSDEDEAAFIRDLFKDWSNLESQLRAVIIKLKKAWVDEEVSKKDIIGYFG